ncbi:MAG: DNA-processing protein DprA [Syntrophomonadaceae bacterium]|jgi:DNA processing protein
MDRLEKAIACTLHSIPGVGNRSLWKIRKLFGDFKSFYEADKLVLYSSFLSTSIINILLEKRRNSPELLMQEYQTKNIKVVCWDEPFYPQSLRNISNPPYILYYQGDINITNQPCFAIVGSRWPTDYGRNTAGKLAKELAAVGMVIVSGMARGIDSEAHWGALTSGKTIAVLGNGLDVVYPRENQKLFGEIINNGVVLSEFPPHTAPKPSHFPMRNRIISGLSRGLLVVEAKEKSGALITVDFALEQGRDVFAIPGPINSKNSVGTNNLIKQGAKLTMSIEDILEEYYDINHVYSKTEPEQLSILDGNEKLLLDIIAHNSMHFDQMLQLTGLDIGSLSTLLFKLELKGIIKSLPGNYYVRL